MKTAELRRLAETLVGPEIAPGRLFSAAEELYRLFCSLSGFAPKSPEARLDVQLAQGRAIGPAWAAHCIHDFMRTRKFLRGVLRAIRAVRKTFPQTRLHIVYAGPGPFATLVVPLLTLLEDEDLEITFLEISPLSIRTLEKLIGGLELGRFVRHIQLGDATSYRVDKPVHLVIVEMMQPALLGEPQVAATLNLVPQIIPGGLLIPQQITVQAGLLHTVRNQKRMLSLDGRTEEVYRTLGPVLDLTQNEVYPAPCPGVPLSFPEIELALAHDADPGFNRLALFTQIRVFEDEILDVWESALTQPEVLLRLEGERKFGFRYGMGGRAGVCVAGDGIRWVGSFLR